jgi:hypothetical protein
MVASRRIFIVSSSHPYHNCKIPFLYEHIMTPIMTPRRRRYLFVLSISSRASTLHIVFAPIMFAIHSHSRINQGRPVPVSPLLVHDHLYLRTLRKAKSFISSSYFPTSALQRVPSITPCISCTIRIVGFVLFVPIPLRYPGFSYYSDTWTSFLFFIVLWVVLVAFSGNNASPFGDCCLFSFCDSIKMSPTVALHRRRVASVMVSQHMTPRWRKWQRGQAPQLQPPQE